MYCNITVNTYVQVSERGAGLQTAQHAAAVAKKTARATAEHIGAVLNSPPPQQAPLARSPPTATLHEAAAFGRGLAGPAECPYSILNGLPAVDRLAEPTDGRCDSL